MLAASAKSACTSFRSAIGPSPRTLRSSLPQRIASTTQLCQWRRCNSSDTTTRTPLNKASDDPLQTSSTASSSSSTSKNEDQPNVTTDEVTQLKLDLQAKDAAAADFKHKYLAALADFQNLQVQSAKREKDAREKAIRSFAKDLVADIEVLKLALDSVPAERRTTEQGELVKLWDGVDSTKKMVESTLARFGVRPFDPTGDIFDPNKHDGQYKAQIPGKEPNTVICSKVGWMLYDSVLRPAQVGVVSE